MNLIRLPRQVPGKHGSFSLVAPNITFNLQEKAEGGDSGVDVAKVSNSVYFYEKALSYYHLNAGKYGLWSEGARLQNVDKLVSSSCSVFACVAFCLYFWANK